MSESNFWVMGGYWKSVLGGSMYDLVSRARMPLASTNSISGKYVLFKPESFSSQKLQIVTF